MTAFVSYIVIGAAIIVVVAVTLAALHLLWNWRHRRFEALRGEATNPTLASDRAYNRLTLARREADLLAAQGADVDRARQLIDLAGRSLEAHESDRAFNLAQAAHETLVQARRRPVRPPASPPLASAPAPAAAGPRPASPAPGSEERPAPLAKNRAEAQFQLRLFEEDLAAADKNAPKDAPVAEARELYSQAQAAFARADYGEAFRLSLRGRRRVGGRVESLGRPASTVPGDQGAGLVADATRSAEETAAQERCPSCGHPKVPGDTFCRGCGTAYGPLTCPSCGAARTPQDTFCGSCGKRYGPA